MRLFIGIEIPEILKSNIQELQNELRSAGVKGHWKRIENLHITLEFLGEINPEIINDISAIINNVSKMHDSFKLSIEGLGAFPNFRRPHTLWTGIKGNTGTLQLIREEMHKELLKLNLKLDNRPYKPHLTIASRPKIYNANIDEFKTVKLGEFAVNDIMLFESKVGNGKRVYNCLYKSCLNHSL